MNRSGTAIVAAVVLSLSITGVAAASGHGGGQSLLARGDSYRATAGATSTATVTITVAARHGHR